MKTIYISGPLTDVPNADVLKAFYEQIGEVCLYLGLVPYIPHQHTDPILHSDYSPQAVYDLDRRNIVKADWVVAYVGRPALGVGQEIEIARANGIPVILLYERGRSVSRMVRGNPAVTVEVVGRDLDNILQELKYVLAQLCAGPGEVETLSAQVSESRCSPVRL
jgi:nucleoside 2-deoxyribosyltransferase